MRPGSVLPEPVLEHLIDLARSVQDVGDFAELGVYRGGAAYELARVARERGRLLFLFDTFTGIPFQGSVDVHRVGDFADTSVTAVRAAIPDAILVPGVFPASLEGQLLDPLAFVHVDCDQYQSVRDACAVFAPLMASGGLMLFDDYGQLEGATKAVQDSGLGPLYLTPHGRALWRKH